MSRAREGTVIAAKYRIERPLARGGMGSIWVARHLQLDMLVAVKFMDGQFAATPEARARFEREARAVALIQSPNVVQVHDYGIHDGAPYMAMELLKGEDLGTRIRREQRLSVQAVATVMGQVCKALRKAHDANIIHRDLKPANIFLVREEDEEIAKVLDFGVAKMIGLGEAGDSTRTGMVVGSVHYMSPEQARGMKDIDQRADLWSIGIIAFRALTGQLPFPGEQVGDVIVKICSEPIPLASSFRPDLGPEVDAFFARALARRPDERFQSARELAAGFVALASQGQLSAPSSAGMALAPGLDAAGADLALTRAYEPPAAFTPAGAAPVLPAQGSPSAVSASTLGTPTPPLWQGPPLGTLTHATQTSDVVDSAGKRGTGLAAVIVVSAVCGVVLVAGGMALFGGHGDKRAAATVSSAGAGPPPPPPATAAVEQSAEIVAPPPPPPPTPAAPEVTAAPTASAVAVVASAVPTASPARTSAPRGTPTPTPAKPPRKINSELGF